jgi:hypothetical protein
MALKKNLQELFDEAQDEVKNTEQVARRKRTHMLMLAKQKGFYFAIFASSILLSAILIISFMTFVFRYGISPNKINGGSNYDLIYNFQTKFTNSTWETKDWTGSFSFGSISSLLNQETMYFKNL